MYRPRHSRYSQLIAVLLIWAPALIAQQQMDTTYAAKIKKYTTDPRFLNDLIDHLPVSESVPSPLQHFGEIIGAPGILHNSAEIFGYLRALAEASPRVSLRKIGESEEGREMLEVIVADEATIASLDTYREYLARLADPRKIDQTEAQRLIEQAKPIYYITAGLHSPETGSPEMVMELVYRLAVEESPLIQNIRNQVIVVINPATEVDGRDRIVDIYRYRQKNNDVGPGLIYWGHYVAHDNNRDGFGMALALTRHMLKTFFYWTPTVMHDLHESVPYLYTSTGTGPYNEFIDPITIQEWQNLAHEEVTELTRRGMPGVWTHNFYTGWAGNYLIWIANLRNAIGRFYETFGNSIPDTKERKLRPRQTSREWYRPSPPFEKVMWSLRNNTNYMQSGVLAALNYTANNRQEFVENFYIKSKNAVQRGRQEAPYAWVIPAEQERKYNAAVLVNLLMEHGIEVHQATKEVTWELRPQGSKYRPANGAAEPDKEKKKVAKQTAGKGSYIVRMDQPYQVVARVLLDEQNFPKSADPPYGDTGWTLPYAFNVEAHRVDDSTILKADMQRVMGTVKVAKEGTGKVKVGVLLANRAEENLATLRFALPDIRMHAIESKVEIGKMRFRPGSLLIKAAEHTAEALDKVIAAAAENGVAFAGLSKMPDVPTHEVEVPRLALVHTWVATPQEAGWWRFAFDELKIPYTYLSEQDLATADLSAFDVVILPRAFASPQTLVAGTTEAGPALPWQQTPEHPHIGRIDETDDVRKGMGYEGLLNLKNFIAKGGLFITEGSTVAFPIEMALIRRVSVRQTRNLVARGSLFRAVVSDAKSPIMYGYQDTIPVYFSQAPVLQVDKNTGGFRVPDWLQDEIWRQEVPRVVLSFAKQDILMSGMLKGENEIVGAPLVVDVPVGQGHVVLFANRPFWRWQTRGSHAMAFNAILHWNDLRTGWPERPKDEEAEATAWMGEGPQ